MTQSIPPAVALFVAALLTAGCQHETTPKVDADRILRMAGDEAGQITLPANRLSRQLNVAYLLIHTGKPAGARPTLAQARETIEHADKDALSEHERLAGWISLSELARGADDDKPFANAALDRALAILKDVTPLDVRCGYVPGVETEVRELRGDAEAVRFLTTAADWAMEIPKQSTRRAAYMTYAAELFRCADYDAARTTLRKDPDAGWRADALTALANRLRAQQPADWPWSSHVMGYAAAVTKSPAAQKGFADPAEQFGTPLDFKSNFLRR